MSEAEPVQIRDASGLSFSAWLKPANGDEDAPQVTLQLTDGTQFMVPQDLLVPAGDGRYTLSVDLREYVRRTPEAAAEETVVSLAAETLRVGKRTVERGRVRLHKTVTERLETAELTLMREQVEVERVAINRPVEEAEPVRYEDDVMVIPRYEEVLVVSKQLMLVEELRVRTVRSERREPQQVTLRREELSVERGDGVEVGISADSDADSDTDRNTDSDTDLNTDLEV